MPGAGNAYEVEYLYNEGFSNTYLLDFSKKSIDNFLKRCPGFPENQIITSDFFKHQGTYDLIIEQTFFSSQPPEKRLEFTKQIYDLLATEGIYLGLLFSHHFGFEGPPYGGTYSEYIQLFSKYFSIAKMEEAHNSIKPRKGREFFVKLIKLNR